MDHTMFKKIAGVSVMAVGSLFVSSHASAATYYMEAGTSGDCETTTTPCSDFSVVTALVSNSNLKGFTVRMTEGTYPLSAQVVLQKAVTFEGGYSRINRFSTRDINKYPTVISGNGVTTRLFEVNTGHAYWTEFDGITFSGVSNTSSVIGAIASSGTGALLRFENCVIENNQQDDGGAIAALISGDKVEINNSIIRNNSARSEGGAIAMGSSTELTVNNTSFTSNTATSDGGAIWAQGAQVTITDSRFTDNTSAKSGAAIYLKTDSAVGDTVLDISGTAFDNNDSGNFGAITFWEANPAVTQTININSSSFANHNTPWAGGALSVGGVNNSVQLNIADSTFYNNVAGDWGGAIALSDNVTAAITYSTFAKNTSPNSVTGGGAIATRMESVSHPSLTLKANLFLNNTAGTSAGGDNFVSFDETVSSTRVLAVNPNLVDAGFNITGYTATGHGFIPPANLDLASTTSFIADKALSEIVTTTEGDDTVVKISTYGGHVTVPLVINSPAVDALVSPDLDFPKACDDGSNSTVDNRGMPRPNRINFTDPGQSNDVRACDIGAFEFNNYYRTDCESEDGWLLDVETGSIVFDMCTVDFKQGLNQFADNLHYGSMNYWALLLFGVPWYRRRRA